MRPTLVNRLSAVSAAFTFCFISAACSSADGHNKSADAIAGSASAAATTPPTSNPASPTGSAAADSLSKAADASRIEGSPSAKLWVIEVSDFQCPYCKEWHDQNYPMILNDYVKTGKIRLAYVNFPLSMHQHAHQAAVAAMCAGAQGKFWPMQDALFSSQDRWEGLPDATASFDSLAKSVGVDMTAYHACLASPSIEALIKGDQYRAQRAGIVSTPSFWVGKTMIVGAVPPAEMKAAIDSALSTK